MGKLKSFWWKNRNNWPERLLLFANKKLNRKQFFRFDKI